MKKRKIFEQQTVDVATGEVVSVTTSTVSGNTESFVMGRTTSGYEWLTDLTALELKLLIVLVDNKGRKDNTVTLSEGKILDICATFDFSTKTVKNALRSMRQKDLVKQVSKGVYLVNPLTFYSGGTNNWKAMQEEYRKLDDLKYKKRNRSSRE